MSEVEDNAVRQRKSTTKTGSVSNDGKEEKGTTNISEASASKNLLTKSKDALNTEEKKATTHSESDELKGSYWLTRIVIIRYMGFIYFVAFLVSLHQNRQLLGKSGLLPADKYLSDLKQRIGKDTPWSLSVYIPTILWFVDYETDIDFWLDSVAWTGIVIAAFMILTGAGNWPLLALQWLLYHSLVNVGQRWFSFGWESQTLETGFLTIFLCPMLSMSNVPKKTPTSRIVIFAYRWLIFRIMLGAGLIKIRGDKCWRDLTCMNYHYETQPVPNPLSYYLHQSPEFIHKFEVLANHFIELIAPAFLLLSRNLCMFGGIIQIFFQVVLIISGNLSFLNWLTILPSLACFDDASLQWMFSSRPNSAKSKVLAIRRQASTAKPALGGTIRRVFNISLGILLAYLSIPVVQNLLSSRQAMNTSFDSLRLVNTYGAFGSVTKKRTEVIFQGTNSSNPSLASTVWEEYQFKCKPGDIYRRPCIISPYHYRLDWLMWFAAFQNYQHNPWLIHLAAKLLQNNEMAEELIAHNPFKDRPPPRFIRAEHYVYKYTKIGSPEAKEGAWWKRKYKGSYLPIVSLSNLMPFMKDMGWSVPPVAVDR